MAVRVRPDVYGLKDWDDTLLWYARAVGHMQQRGESDPTSWRYQANVHGNQPEGLQPGEWDLCEHQTWFFLPWHRAYLYCWETIVQAAIVEVGGPSGWSLPYWNYSDKTNANARILPPAFRAPTLPDGTTPNPLLCDRGSNANSGQVIFRPSHVSVAALDEPQFPGAPHGGSTGFGGPVTGFPNHAGAASGVLENVPHNAVHVDISGLMQDPDTAAQDPIFWLHHANIDRLWMIWLSNSSHRNPTDGAWLNATYPLHDASGTVTFTAAQVLDPTAAPLSYTYESLADPRTAPPTPPAVTTPPHPQVPEMLGATEAPVSLAADPVHTSLRLEPPSGPAAPKAFAPESGRRVHLNLENVTGETGAVNYDVYVDLPQGADPDEHQELLAGVLAPFGVARSSTRRDPHTGGSGLNAAFDITSVVAHLQAEGLWDPQNVRVSFVPTVGDDQPAPLNIGRISLYVTP